MRVMNKNEVADFLQISVRQVDYLRKEGKLAYVQVGRCVRFRLVDVERFLEERLVAPKRKKAHNS